MLYDPLNDPGVRCTSKSFCINGSTWNNRLSLSLTCQYSYYSWYFVYLFILLFCIEPSQFDFYLNSFYRGLYKNKFWLFTLNFNLTYLTVWFSRRPQPSNFRSKITVFPSPSVFDESCSQVTRSSSFGLNSR